MTDPTTDPGRPTLPGGRAGVAIRRTTALLGSDLRIYGLATFADQGGRILLNLVAAAALGPLVFGTWILVAAVIQYSTYASLGLVNGAAREIPRLRGAGEPEHAAMVEDVAAGGAIIAALAAGLAAVVLSPSLFGTSLVEPWLVGLAVIFQQLFFLQQILFRANLRFGAAAGQLGITAVAVPALGIPLLPWSVNGLVLARLLVSALVVGVATRRLPRVPRPRWRPDVAASLVRVGAPVMLAGLVFALLITIDRWLVDAWFGREAVGQYGIVTMAVAGLLVIPTFLSQQLYPHLSHARGAGADGRQILTSAVQFGFVAGALTAVAGVVVAGTAVLLVPLFLPAYMEAIGPLAIGCAAVSVYAASSGLGYVLNLTGRQRALVLSQIIALGIDVALAAVFAAAGLGLASFPLALLVTFAGYWGGMYILARDAAERDHGAKR